MGNIAEIENRITELQQQLDTYQRAVIRNADRLDQARQDLADLEGRWVPTLLDVALEKTPQSNALALREAIRDAHRDIEEAETVAAELDRLVDRTERRIVSSEMSLAQAQEDKRLHDLNARILEMDDDGHIVEEIMVELNVEKAYVRRLVPEVKIGGRRFNSPSMMM